VIRLVVFAAALGIATPVAAQDSPDVEALELALKIPMERFDTIQFINAARGATTGVYEVYCGLGFLIPDPEDDGVSGVDLALGIGCLVGATTLFVMTGMRIASMGDHSDGWSRLRRFREAQADGLSQQELLVFERELADEASAARLRRGMSIGLGAALLVACGLLIGFTATGDIDPVTGTIIAAGTGVVGVMSLIPIFLDSPAEAAERAFRAGL